MASLDLDSFSRSRKTTVRPHTPHRQMLTALRRHGPLARAELARRLGVSAATISAAAAALLARGTLVETPAPARPMELRERRGRPPVLLDIAPGAGTVLSLRVTLDRVELALADARGEVATVQPEAVRLRDGDAEQVVAALAHVIHRFLATSGRPPHAVAIAFQGFVDANRGVVVWSPVLACRNLPLAERLSARLGRPVVVENDASSLAVGLARREPRYALGRTAVILLGSGVGLGLIFDGQIYRGVRAGGSEYGHIRIGAHGPQCRCGARGCIEASVADYALYRDARLALGEAAAAAGDPDEAEMAELVRRGVEGHPRIAAVFAAAAEVLAEGVSILMQLLQPDHVLISGPGVRARPLLEPALRSRLEATAIPEILAQTRIEFCDFAPRQIVEGVLQRALALLDDELAEA